MSADVTHGPYTGHGDQPGRLVAEFLGCSVADLDGHSFFELGGSSLDAARVARILRSGAGLNLAPGQILEASSVGALIHDAVSRMNGQQAGQADQAEHFIAAGQRVPLTWQQRVIWYQSVLEPSSPRYLFHALFHFDRAPDPVRLADELRRLLVHHPALRIRLVFVDGQPWQEVPLTQIQEPVLVPVIELDREFATPEELVQASGANRPFDLTADLLIRWTLVRLPAGKAALVHTEHHLVHDGVSFEVLLRTIGNEGVTGSGYRYLQYARRQQEPDPVVIRQTASEYRAAAVDLFPRLAEPATADPFLRLPVPADLLDATRHTCRRNGISLFTALFTGFCSALAEWRGQDQFLLGTAVSNRPPGSEDVVGMFVATTPVFFRRAWGEPPEATLRTTATALRAAIDRADMPVTDLAAAIGQVRGSDRGVVSAAFSMHEQTIDRVQLAGQDAHVDVAIFNGAAKFPVNVIVKADRAGPRTYCTLLMDGDRLHITEDDLWGLWTRFIAWLQLLTCLQPRQQPEGPDVVSAVREVARTAPSQVAIQDSSECFTYEDLTRAGDALRALLGRSHPDGAGLPVSAIALLGEASARYWVAAYAAMDAGAAYVPLDAMRYPHVLAEMVRKAGCGYVLTLQELSDGAQAELLTTLDETVTVVPWRTLWQAAKAVDPRKRTASTSTGSARNRTAYIMFTSGSTGIPKGVRVSRANLARLCQWAVAEEALQERTVVSQMVSTGFDVSALEIWPTLTAGAQVQVAPTALRGDPTALAQWLAGHQVEVALAPTPVAELLIRHDWPGSLRLRLLGAAGDRLHPLGRRLPFRVVNLYGPTECTVISAWHWVSWDEETMPPIGRVMPYAFARVTAPDGSLLPAGHEGELWIGGGGVGEGYIGQDELTKARFVPDPHSPRGDLVYRTGDLVRSDSDGTLHFIGRRDRQVKISGVRVELGEIEATALRVPGVRQAVATVDKSGVRPTLTLYVVPASQETVQDLVRDTRSALPAFLRHATIVPLQKIPLTPNGKADLVALAGMTVTRRPGGQVTNMARQYLGATDLDAAWFTLGGSSLEGARFISEADREFGAEIKLKDLLRADSVELYLARFDAADEPGAPQADHGAGQGRGGGTEPGALTAVNNAGDLLWPALERLSPQDKLDIAQRLLQAARNKVRP